MARLRRAPSTQQPAAQSKSKSAGRPPLKEKTNTTRPNAPVYDDDGNTEGLVKNVKRKRGRPRKTQQNSDELVMAGGLGLPTSEHAQPNSEPQVTTDELEKRDDRPAVAAKPNRRPQRTVKKATQSEAQGKVLEGLKQRMQETANGQKGNQKTAPTNADSAAALSSNSLDRPYTTSQNAKPAATERSEYSLSPSPPASGKLSVVKSKRTSTVVPGSALRAQGTPAIESSILALKNFKRRPRQPSMLQMVQQRTASARPSMANTAMEATAIEDSGAFDLDLETEGEDDFAPEAEGTPLHVRKANRQSATSSKPLPDSRTALAAMASRKRTSNDLSDPTSSLGRLRSKRRKSMAAEDDPQGEPMSPEQTLEVSATQPSSERPETPRPPITSDVQVINSPSTSTPPSEPPPSHARPAAKQDDFIVPSTEPNDDELDHNHEMLADDIVNGTMADPLSSSPLRGNISRADHLADPVTQVSSVTTKPKSKKKANALSTAVLQSLLPKKRAPLKARLRKSEYDFESDSDEEAPLDASHLDDDEDELGGRLRRQTRLAQQPKVKRGRPAKTSIAAKQTSTATGRAGHKSGTTAGVKKGPRTYGRAATSDKENESYESHDETEEENEESTLPDVSISMEEAVKSKEIEEAKRKFADIDEWDMQFETVSVDDNHRSSSQDWR